MSGDYNKLFPMLIEINMTSSQLMEKAGFSANIITHLKRNEYASLSTMESVCRTLNCLVNDVLQFLTEIPNES